MIAACHPTNASNGAMPASSAGTNDESTHYWPVKVVDRIAMFEQRILDSMSSSCKRIQSHKTIVDGDGDTVRSFLESIGEQAPATIPPRLWQCASKWRKRLQDREKRQQNDNLFYTLSRELDRLDAVLYSDCTSLEIEAIDDLVASTCSNREEKGYDFDYCEDSDDEQTLSDDGGSMIVCDMLATLESGVKELAQELEQFK